MRFKFALIALIPFATVFALHASADAQSTSQPPAATSQPPAQPPGDQPAAGGPKTSVWDGIYTEDHANRGKQLYSDACASCHGPELTGGEMAPPLVGGDFTSDWNGLSVGDLFDRMRISMPQNAPGSLTGQQNADILAFVLQANKFPSGTAELAKDAMMLKGIKFETTKPGN